MAEPRDETGVVVVTRNRRTRLLTTLEYLTALPERPPIAVVDNASADGTAAAVRDRYPDVQLLRRPRNEGAVARNHGVAALRTPYVAFSDDDSWWYPGALRRAAAVLRAHPRLGLLAAAALVGPEQTPDPLNAVLAASPLGTAPDLPGPSVLGFLACAAVVRRGAFLKAGGFHPLLHFGAEETLLAIDLAAAGWGVAHDPRVAAHHDPDPAPRPGRSARVLRNQLLTTWLRRPWPQVAAATRGLARSARSEPEARRAFAEALPRLPAAVRQRRRIPDWLEHDLRLLAHGTGSPVAQPGRDEDPPTKDQPCPTPAPPSR